MASRGSQYIEGYWRNIPAKVVEKLDMEPPGGAIIRDLAQMADPAIIGLMEPSSFPVPPNPDLFVALGTDSANRWHHRVAWADSAQQLDQWWHDQLGQPPAVVMSVTQVEAGMAGIAEMIRQCGARNVWGGWMRSDTSVRMIAVSADTQKEARQQLRAHSTAGERLAALVDPSPWWALLAHLRAVQADERPADEDLRKPAGPARA
jgi:hypothetical protein